MYIVIIVKKLKNWRLYRIIILLVLDGLFFGLTNPNTINSIFLILGFILLGLTFYLLLESLLAALITIGIRLKSSRRMAVFGSVVLTSLFVMQSLGQLSVKDFYVIVLIAAVAYVYTAKARA